MSIFRKAYSVVGALLMLQFFAQLYFIAVAVFTILLANDNAKDVYSAFKNADTFAGLHAVNGDLIGLTILVMLGLSFGSRYPWRTTILTGLLFVLLVAQLLLAHTGIPVLSGLHGLNALIMVGSVGTSPAPPGPSVADRSARQRPRTRRSGPLLLCDGGGRGHRSCAGRKTR